MPPNPMVGRLFPVVGTSTGALDLPLRVPVSQGDRSVMMPRRTQSREQDRRDRIAAERRERCELITQEGRQRGAWLAATYEPPPF
jgi:hypothetical protein